MYVVKTKKNSYEGLHEFQLITSQFHLCLEQQSYLKPTKLCILLDVEKGIHAFKILGSMLITS